MRTRLEDLIATAERQQASGSLDAAIDTYRTALGEPGAAEAGVEAKLQAALKARGDVLPAEPVVALPEPPLVETTSPAVEATTQPDPAPAPAPIVDDEPIEPPSFHLMEDEPSLLERPRRQEYDVEPPLSILDPTPRPADHTLVAVAMGLAALIAALAASFGSGSHVNRVRPQRSSQETYPAANGITAPIPISYTEPEYTEAARQAGIEGTVLLYVQVEPDGAPGYSKVLRGLDPELDNRAMEALKRWRFQPGLKEGQPVRAWSRVEVHFRLP